MFENLNRKETVKPGINTEEMDFHPLGDYVDGEIIVDGFFFTDGKYGKQVVVVGNGAKINMPKRAVEAFEAIEASDEMLASLLDGHCMLTDIRPVTGKNGDTFSYSFKTI